MKKLLLLFGLSLLILQSKAQDLGPISIDKNHIKIRYYAQNARINRNTISKIVEPNLIASQDVKRGRSMRGWAWGVGFLSGAMIGSGIAQPEDNAGAMIGIGCVGAIGSFILQSRGNKRIERGINVYNSSISPKSSQNPASLKFGFADHGVGLTVTF